MARCTVLIGITAEMLAAQQSKTAPRANPGVEHVIEAMTSGASEDLIIETLRSEGKAYTLTIADLAKLKKAGASDNIIRVMKNPRAEGAVVASEPPAAGLPAPSSAAIPKGYPGIGWRIDHHQVLITEIRSGGDYPLVGTYTGSVITPKLYEYWIVVKP